MSSDGVQVAIRAAKSTTKELLHSKKNAWVIRENTIRPSDESIPKEGYPMEFDHVFDSDVTNKNVYETAVRPMVSVALEGFNSTIFSYGPTSSGKLMTMEGSIEDAGMIPRAIDHVFKAIEKVKKPVNHLLRIAYMMLDNDNAYDLLKISKEGVNIYANDNDTITIGAKEAVISSKDQAFDLFALGMKNRSLYREKYLLNCNNYNIIFRVIIERELKNANDVLFPISHLNFVILAGSERVPRGSNIAKFAEREYINKSMSIFTSTIDKNIYQAQIQYRESLLTTLFRNSFGGNAKTLFIANFVKSSTENAYFTMCFARKAKKICNKPTINIISSTQSILYQILTQIRKLEEEVTDVKAHCAMLKTVGQVMQTIDILHERMNLLNIVFTKTDYSFDQDRNFHGLLTKLQSTDVSVLERRILNVITSNNIFNEYRIGKRLKLPFEMMFFNLCADIGNEFIVQTREEFEDLRISDYLVSNGTCLKFEDESDIEFSDEEAEIMPDLLNISVEYSTLEKSITSRIQNKDLKSDVLNLSTIFKTTHSEDVIVRESIEKQNQALLDEIAVLNERISTQENEKSALTEKIEFLKSELEKRNKPIPGDFRREYELLLVQMDQKDMDYIALSNEKKQLENTVEELNTALQRCKSPTRGFEAVDVNESNAAYLAEIRFLNQQLADQDFAMAEKMAKYKRREQELVKRLQDKEIIQGKVHSVFVKSEKEVQASPGVEDTVSQTEEDVNISFDASMQTDEKWTSISLEEDKSELEAEKSLAEETPVLEAERKLEHESLQAQESVSTEINNPCSSLQSSVGHTESIQSMTSDDYTEVVRAEDVSCQLVDLKKCTMVIQENQALLKNVKELEFLYIRDITKHVQENPMFLEKMKKKEAELSEIKGDLHEVESKLRVTNEELHKLKHTTIAANVALSSKTTTEKLEEGIEACETCLELTSTIQKLQNRLATLQLHHSNPSLTKEEYEAELQIQKQELENLHNCNDAISKKYLQLKHEYEKLQNMIISQGETGLCHEEEGSGEHRDLSCGIS